jgi:hypothetical protein
VRSIDLSHNIFDPKSLDELSKVLVADRVIRKIGLQDCGMSEVSVIEDFLKKIVARGAPLDLPIPREDLEELVIRQKSIDLDGLSGLIALFAKVRQGDSTVILPEETLQRVAPPPQPSYRQTPGGDPTPGLAEGTDGAQPMRMIRPSPNEWEFEVPNVPEPDNSAIFSQFHEVFSVEKLLGKLRGGGARIE